MANTKQKLTVDSQTMKTRESKDINMENNQLTKEGSKRGRKKEENDKTL